MRRTTRRAGSLWLGLAWMIGVMPQAHAGEFAEDGTFSFDVASTARLTFEATSEGGAGGGASGGAGGAGGATSSDDSALEGTGVLTLSAFEGVDLPVEVLPTARTYRVSVWIRDGEVNADVEISYGNAVDELAVLYPTGRMTSDGWVELANEGIRIDGRRAPKVTLGFFSPSGASVDAAEMVPDGVIALEEENRACKGLRDPVCAVDQVCSFSECRNVNAWVPPIPADRENVTRYLENRMRFLFGPFIERRLDLPASLTAIEGMRQATKPWAYWNGFMLAVRRLHDGHTSTSGVADFVLRNQKPITACFIEGDANLSHAIVPKDPLYLDVLVSHTGADHNLGLVAGDRLVSVDGQHPVAWARSLVDVHWSMSPISNHETYAELAESMRSLISRYAHEIVVIRCNAGSASCAAPETIVIADLPAVPEDEPIANVACDNRPKRHLADSPANHGGMSSAVLRGLVVESNDVERIYGMEWSSLYVTSNSDTVGAGLNAAVTLFRDNARGVIWDHRVGNGGTGLGPAILWAFAVPNHPSNLYIDRQLAEEEQPSLEQGVAIFEGGKARGYVEYAGSTSPTSMPVALLLTRDVSASDWLPLGLKGKSPNVKIFAPYETNGAFSTRYAFGYWLGMSYVMAVGDTFTPDGRSLNGEGIEPDVVVLPLQSDLLQGQDTVYNAALAWVRTGLLQ